MTQVQVLAEASLVGMHSASWYILSSVAPYGWEYHISRDGLHCIEGVIAHLIKAVQYALVLLRLLCKRLVSVLNVIVVNNLDIKLI